MRLDKLDRQILAMLVEDARTPFTKIASNVTKELRKMGELGPKDKIPDTTIHFRVKKLKDNGIIRRFTINIPPESLGFDLFALISFKIGGHIIEDISVKRTEEISKKFLKDTRIRFLATGEDKTSLFALIIAENQDALEAFIRELRNDPDIQEINLWSISKVLKGKDMITPSPL